MFDSLNRRYLPPYGCDWVHAPNFERLAKHSAVFDNCYVGSMPCMPARRELHTGRYNFMHRGWSPLEPFDDSMPEILKKAGVHTHIISDHSHYWEDGGATYHSRYSTWECVRGQEGDPWKCDLDTNVSPDFFIPSDNPLVNQFKMPYYKQNAVNRRFMTTAAESSLTQVFDGGVSFLDRNHSHDDWFLQVEAFDPHEPFFTFEEYIKMYDLPDIGKQWDWPPYDKVKETDEEIRHLRVKYAALVSQCDENLGRILDKMDEYDLWKDTMLIVNTDHGFLLGEHGWWSKNLMPCYDEIVHIPLFIWDPRCGIQGQRREALVQTIDLAPTLLNYFQQKIPEDMQGKSLKQTVEQDRPVREYAVFGYFGNQMNVTDGRYVYMHHPVDREVPIYEYTLMPLRLDKRMSRELETASLAEPFDFTKNMPVLKIKAKPTDGYTSEYGSQLFDLEQDPDQLHPIENQQIRDRLLEGAAKLMYETDAPRELFDRMGITK